MVRISRFGLALCVSLQACSAKDDDHDQASNASLPAASRADLERTLDEVVAAGVAPGVSLTVSHPSYDVWSGAAGVANVESGAKLSPAERFRAGSMLKTAVAVAVLQLVERNELALDDTLPALLPQSITSRIPDADAIQVRMLLAHTVARRATRASSSTTPQRAPSRVAS